MADQNSEEWLPAGWTVEVKVRKNGRRDKYYYESSSGHRFSSRAEVSRYLSTSKTSCEDKQKIEETLKRPSDDVVVEKTVAERLPPGWIKEIRVTKKARKIRRDTHYIAPVSEKVFHSLRDVHRYLENEEPGRLNVEPSGSSDKELEDEKSSKQKLDNASLNFNETTKDGEILNCSCNGEGLPLPEHTSDQSGVGTELGSLNPSEAKGSEQNEQDGDSTKSECISAPAGGDPPDNQCLESGMIKHEINRSGLCKSKNKKELILPRRASKRLAGVEVGPFPELKTSIRARRAATEQSGEGTRHTTEGPSLPEHSSDQSEVGSLNPPESKGSEQKEQDCDSTKNECISIPAGGGPPDKQCLETGLIKHEGKKTHLDLCKSKNKMEPIVPRRASMRLAGVEAGPVPEVKPSTPARRFAVKQSGEGVHRTTEGSSLGNLPSCAFQQPDYHEVEPEKHIQNVEQAINGDAKQRCASVFPLGSRSSPEEHAGKLETDYKAEEKPGLQPDLPLGDFFTDPCIAFAIETLTGIGFDNARSDGDHSSGGLTTPKDHHGDIDNKSSGKQESGNLFIPERWGKVGKDDDAGQKSGSPTELPFGGSWPDPCIEFAIKTLTGAIPVDYDPHIEEYFQQQLSSSKTQGTSDLTLKNVGLDNFCQTDDLCEQFCHAEVPVLKKQALSEPRHTRSRSLHSSGGSDVNQKGRQRH
ncbi:hypothetical protein ACFX2I_001939 [Malus domestica]